MKAFILAAVWYVLEGKLMFAPSQWLKLVGPILWHIMNLYAYHGIKDFAICLGYNEYIKKFFWIAHPRYRTVNLENREL